MNLVRYLYLLFNFDMFITTSIESVLLSVFLSGDVTGVEGDPDCSVWSSAVDEGLELSQRLCESVFSGPEGEMEAEGEELMLGACTRLRTAVDKLLELVSESSHQVP